MAELNFAELKNKNVGRQTVSALVRADIHQALKDLAHAERTPLINLFLEGIMYVLDKRGIKL